MSLSHRRPIPFLGDGGQALGGGRLPATLLCVTTMPAAKGQRACPYCSDLPRGGAVLRAEIGADDFRPWHLASFRCDTELVRYRRAYRTSSSNQSRLMGTRSSTTLADLLTPLLFADLSSAVGTSLRSWSNDEFDDGVAYGREARLRRWAVDSFFSAPLVRDDGVGGMRKRPWS